MTEDYYLANKLMKGIIGSANIDTNSRLCMSSSLSRYKRAFGSDTVPRGYEDFEQADLLVLVGSNLASCHPVLFQRISAAKDKRPQLKIVVIDPRHTPTCEICEIADTHFHLAIKSGSDAWLFNGLLDFIRRNDQEKSTQKFASALQAVPVSNVPTVAQQCGLDEQQIINFFRLVPKKS